MARAAELDRVERGPGEREKTAEAEKRVSISKWVARWRRFRSGRATASLGLGRAVVDGVGGCPGREGTLARNEALNFGRSAVPTDRFSNKNGSVTFEKCASLEGICISESVRVYVTACRSSDFQPPSPLN